MWLKTLESAVSFEFEVFGLHLIAAPNVISLNNGI